MSQDYVHGQNNPNQQLPPDKLTIGEALTLIARRTAFPTEEDSRAVLAAIEAHYGEQSPADTDGDQADEHHGESEADELARLRRENVELRTKSAEHGTTDETSAGSGEATGARSTGTDQASGHGVNQSSNHGARSTTANRRSTK